MIPLHVRLWTKVNRKGQNDCWEWTGRVNEWGYGILSEGTKYFYAHREAYKDVVGEIPSGMFVCHRCDNPKCCNPYHLWIGTAADNNKDKMNKGRHISLAGEKHWKAKLTNEQILLIAKDKRSQRAIAAAYGVTKSVIQRIKSGTGWKCVKR